MSMKFSEVAATVGARRAPQNSVRRALDALGSKADLPLDGLDTERKLQLVGLFVRALRNVGVAEAAQIQHDLYASLGAAPTARRPVAIKDAISLVTVRNHVQQLTAALGVPWALGMQMQSAISDVARFVSAHGGGRIETEAAEAHIHFVVTVTRKLGPIGLAGAHVPPWLIGVSQLASNLEVADEGEGTALTFDISVTQSLVA
jgi:hypothetical protein